MSSRSAVLFLPVALLLAGCRPPTERITIGAAGQSLTVEVARTEAQRERGLMERKDLGPRDGMIFVFERDDHLTFWMKNTPTPLSIAFLSAEGKVLQIEDMEPFSETTVRSKIAARYAFEMKKGAFGVLGIGVGDVVTFPKNFP
jgi:uncharacterized membrane protein (UPF0127 family)